MPVNQMLTHQLYIYIMIYIPTVRLFEKALYWQSLVSS